MRKVLLIIAFIVIITGCSKEEIKNKIKENVDNNSIVTKSIMELEKYQNFDINKVSSLSILKYTEAGIDEEKITDLNRITAEFNFIKKYRIIGETKSACDDNTTIYQFNMQDGSKLDFEFECNWLVIGNKHYEVERG